jgi:DNA (cytosine-5)-methyltransferase 1
MAARPTAAAPTALDLFCGVGGLSLGLVQSGFRLIGAVDIDQGSLQSHSDNFPGVPTHQCDLFFTSGNDIRSALGIRRTAIDLLAGGPPCQGFSAGGIQAKRDPRNHGVLAFARLVSELRPRYFLMENVRGLLFRQHAPLRGQFTRLLREAGYEVRPFHLLNAADFGVPQRRVRAFVLGSQSPLSPPEYPSTLPIPRPTVRDAISDLAVLDKEGHAADVDEFRGRLGEPSSYARRLRTSVAGRRRRTLTGCLRTLHAAEVVQRFRATLPGDQEPISRFFRLCWDGISPTIRAGTGPEHGSYTARSTGLTSPSECI